MRKTRIDNVYILNSDGISVKKFHINDLQEAEKEAKELQRYHNRKYEVKIVNEYVDNNGYGFQAKPSEVNQ